MVLHDVMLDPGISHSNECTAIESQAGQDLDSKQKPYDNHNMVGARICIIFRINFLFTVTGHHLHFNPLEDQLTQALHAAHNRSETEKLKD